MLHRRCSTGFWTHLWKVLLRKKLCKGAKRPQCNPHFASELVVNDLILVSRTFPRKVKSRYPNKRLYHQRVEKNKEYLIFNFNLFPRSNFIIWCIDQFLNTVYHVRKNDFHNHLKKAQAMIDICMCRLQSGWEGSIRLLTLISLVKMRLNCRRFAPLFNPQFPVVKPRLPI